MSIETVNTYRCDREDKCDSIEDWCDELPWNWADHYMNDDVLCDECIEKGWYFNDKGEIVLSDYGKVWRALDNLHHSIGNGIKFSIKKCKNGFSSVKFKLGDNNIILKLNKHFTDIFEYGKVHYRKNKNYSLNDILDDIECCMSDGLELPKGIKSDNIIYGPLRHVKCGDYEVKLVKK